MILFSMKMLSVRVLPFLLLQLIPSTRSTLVEPCTVLMITSQTTYFTETINITECCTNWCTMNCTKSEVVTKSATTYMQVYKCCPGYGGNDCLPECDDSCNSNQLCAAPSTCECRYGWTGDNCAQVDSLTVTSVEATSISLQWLRANNDNVNSYFIVWSNNEDSQNKSIDAGANVTTITGLIPHKNYRCCVVPVLISGNGTEICVEQLTLQAEPSSYPLPVFSYIGSSVLLVEWSPPVAPNGIIKHYTLYINYSSASEISISKVDSQFNLFLINNLTRRQLVGVSISASTVVGEGPRSPFVFNTTISSDNNANITVTEQGDFTIVTIDDVTRIRWTPPTGIGMVKFYSVILSKLDTNIAEWTLANDQVLDIEIDLDPYTPYQLDSLVQTEVGAIGIFESLTFFTKEGKPLVYPVILDVRRATPSSILVEWKAFSLIESRGYITSYIVKYGMTYGACDNVNTLQSTTTSHVLITLDSLDVQMDYCVTVAAETSVGAGPQSELSLVNVFPYQQFAIYFSGIGDCQKWIETDAIYKANNLTQTISGILSKDCLCQFSYKHIGEQHFSCSESSRDIVIFEGRIIGTAERHSSDILQMLQKWVNEGAKISLSGIQLQVINDCSVSQDSYGSDTCNFVNNSTQVIEPIPCNSAATTVLAVLFATTLVLLIFTCAMLWTCFCHYRRSNKEHGPSNDVYIYKAESHSVCNSEED